VRRVWCSLRGVHRQSCSTARRRPSRQPMCTLLGLDTYHREQPRRSSRLVEKPASRSTGCRLIYDPIPGRNAASILVGVPERSPVCRWSQQSTTDAYEEMPHGRDAQLRLRRLLRSLADRRAEPCYEASGTRSPPRPDGTSKRIYGQERRCRGWPAEAMVLVRRRESRALLLPNKGRAERARPWLSRLRSRAEAEHGEAT
jgi:hypothetical protein